MGRCLQLSAKQRQATRPLSRRDQEARFLAAHLSILLPVHLGWPYSTGKSTDVLYASPTLPNGTNQLRICLQVMKKGRNDQCRRSHCKGCRNSAGGEHEHGNCGGTHRICVKSLFKSRSSAAIARSSTFVCLYQVKISRSGRDSPRTSHTGLW